MSLNLILKFIIALAGAATFVIVVGLITNQAYEPIKGKGPGYALPEPQVAQAASEASTSATPVEQASTLAPAPAEQTVSEVTSLPALLASADIEAGAKVARKCIACHSVKPDLRTLSGPPLYDIVDQPIARTTGYKYSDIMLELAGEGKFWTFENLDAFLTKPRDFAPQTKMGFAGLKSDLDRANLLVYLQSLSENPVPLPTE